VAQLWVVRPLGIMTPVKQITAYTCGLACIQSLGTDRQIPDVHQCKLIERFPDLLGLGKPDAGKITPYIFYHILRSLGLADHFVCGIGREFLESHKDKIDTGIFIFTEKDDDGLGDMFHCWRIENIRQDDFVVVEPSPAYPHHYKVLPWDYLERRRCSIHVCIPK
jgi:hypothetical protein